MNFATIQNQETTAAKNCSSSSSTTYNNNLDSAFNSANLQFPKNFITAQNIYSNFNSPLQRLQEDNNQQEESSETADNSMLMTNSYETAIIKTTDDDDDNDGKEEELLNQQLGRELLNDESLKLNSSQETNEFTLPPLTTTLSLKTQHSTSSTSSSSSAPVNINFEINSTRDSIQQPQLHELPHNSTENLYSSEAADKQFILDVLEAQLSSINKTPSPKVNKSPIRISSKGKLPKTPSLTKFSNDEDIISKSSDLSGELLRGSILSHSSTGEIKSKNITRLSERAKKKSWYNVLYPNYKSRAEDFKKLFKEIPNDERLIVDYSCALQRDILVQGRLYVSQNYVCFHANIFSWETYLSLKWKDVTSITKEKTALVIPNAISICTAKDKYFFATFAARDKAFLMLFRVWQNTLMNKQLQPQEIWQFVHNIYGDELGLTTDDEDYIDPTAYTNDLETELDFISALEDPTTFGLAATSKATNLIDNIINLTGNQSINQNPTLLNSGGGNNSSTSSGSGVRKSKSKSYFFNSHKRNLNSSTTGSASASGSDNKASDSKSNNNKMKANAKELTLISVKPDENITSLDAIVPSIHNNDILGATNFQTSLTSKESKSSVGELTKRKTSKINRQREETLAKNNEAIPTDISGSSDSEQNIPFIATTECTSPHEGRQLLHTILPINIDVLFNLLFSKSKFFTDFHESRNSLDLDLGEWTKNNQGQKTRTVNVTVQVAASVGPKTARVTEEQLIRDCSKPGELYSIDVNTTNAGIPYADSFSVLMHFCLVRTVDDHTMLSVHGQIKYKKSIWAVVKGFIEKNTWAGLEEFYTSLLQNLQNETCLLPAKGKGRRPRRGTTTQTRISDELPAVQGKTDVSESSTTTKIIPPNISSNQAIGIASQKKYKRLSIFIIVLLGFLVAFNVILLNKLWKLEERVDYDLSQRTRMPNLGSISELPSSHDEWLNLLRQQEILHETELKKWHKVLQTAIQLLKKTEKTLAALMFH